MRLHLILPDKTSSTATFLPPTNRPVIQRQRGAASAGTWALLQGGRCVVGAAWGRAASLTSWRYIHVLRHVWPLAQTAAEPRPRPARAGGRHPPPGSDHPLYPADWKTGGTKPYPGQRGRWRSAHRPRLSRRRPWRPDHKPIGGWRDRRKRWRRRGPHHLAGGSGAAGPG